jgi:ATP-dependent helicase HrpA
MRMSDPSEQLDARLRDCMQADRHRLRQRLRKLDRDVAAEKLAVLEAEIGRSVERRARREANRPAIEYPADLPVADKRDEIAWAIAEHQVVVICGETGSGKTTQLPKICLELGRGVAGFIGHTQPRRIAARSVATRIAEELGSEVGKAVGYKVRFSDHVSPEGYIKLMTDGILLAETQQDRFLDQYDTLIIDEAHERSLNIDFLLGYLKQLLPKRPDLKLIITSATIDPARFSRHFDAAPIIEVSGRSYPVELRYRSLIADDEDERDRDLQEAILEAVHELAGEGPGDILVFLPGERQIRETAEALRKHHPRGTEILPLYGRLSATEQNRVFQPHSDRRIVLATNVAETSLTVPGIKYVIDTGSARISRYSWRSKVQRLPIEPISQASANQRAGRCGRTSEGICIRLYSQEDYEGRPRFTDPEILRTNLAAVILQMKHLRLGEVAQFPFIDTPDARLVKDGYKLLHELGAVDERNRITSSGRQLARLPIDPRLGRMLLAATRENALREVLVIVAALAVQDPRERPHDHRQAADQRHARFNDERSDFLSLLNLWDYYHEQARHLSRNKLRQLCRHEFLSYVRMREWHDIHQQLRGQLHDMGLRENQQPAEYAEIHRALLTGLLSQVGLVDEKHEYLGARNRRFMIFPGSGLFKKSPKWLVAGELVETARLYARSVAKIDPRWVEELGAHLLKHHYFSAHWNAKSARVDAFDRVSLYGLVINPKRRVDYARIVPGEARAIFIREALVEGAYRSKAPFLAHNRKLIGEVEDLEAKARRRDILVDEHSLFDFYDRRIPADVHDGASFEVWRKQIERETPQLLFFDKADLFAGTVTSVSGQAFPDRIEMAGMRLPLSYRFEPGSSGDGVTLRVPVATLNQIDAARCEWLVPGLLEDKLAALIKSLPKRLRRNFVPAPDFARACASAMPFGEGPLRDRLAAELQRMTGIEVPQDAWDIDALERHLRMRFEVVDAKGTTLASGRDLQALRDELEGRAAEVFAELPTQQWEREGMRDWDCGEIPETVDVDSHGMRIPGFPALVDDGESVSLRILDHEAQAHLEHDYGVLRLLRLRLKEPLKYLERNLPHAQDLCLSFAAVGSCQALKEDIIEASLRNVFLTGQEAPRSREAFETILESGRGHLVEYANALCERLAPVLREYHEIRKTLEGDLPLSWIEAARDVLDQLEWLIYPGFVSATPEEWLRQFPRYLKAIQRRLARLDHEPDKDRRLRGEIEPVWADCKQRLEHAWERGEPVESLEEFRWLVEELRISLFAQEIGTLRPVSAQRLEKMKKAIPL